MGFSNPLSGTLPTVVHEGYFLSWRGKINSFERLAEPMTRTLF